MERDTLFSYHKVGARHGLQYGMCYSLWYRSSLAVLQRLEPGAPAKHFAPPIPLPPTPPCTPQASERFLQQMVSLFVASHYKNTPNDLLLMADAPAHHLFALLAPVDEAAGVLPDVLAVVQVGLLAVVAGVEEWQAWGAAWWLYVEGHDLGATSQPTNEPS